MQPTNKVIKYNLGDFAPFYELENIHFKNKYFSFVFQTNIYFIFLYAVHLK